MLASSNQKVNGLGIALHAASRDFLRWVAGSCRTHSRRRLAERDRYRFRVVAKSQSGPQLRTLAVSASNPSDARNLANRHLGPGWTLLEISEDL